MSDRDPSVFKGHTVCARVAGVAVCLRMHAACCGFHLPFACNIRGKKALCGDMLGVENVCAMARGLCKGQVVPGSAGGRACCVSLCFVRLPAAASPTVSAYEVGLSSFFILTVSVMSSRLLPAAAADSSIIMPGASSYRVYRATPWRSR